MEHLRQKYDEKGYDFYFKAKDLKKILHIDNRIIGSICTELVKDGKLGIWNPNVGRNSTYQTKFNNGHDSLQDYCEHCGSELTPSNMCNNPKCPENGIIQVFKLDQKEKFIDEIQVEREVCK